MTEFQIAGALISGILRITHPDQYRMGYQTLRHLAEIPQVASTLRRWPTVFHAITLICNRSSPLHRELKGNLSFFDLLVSVGDYRYAPLQLGPVGLQLPNTAGSIAAFSGKGFLHGAAMPDGPRVCHSFYMRKDLQEFTGVMPCQFMTQDMYRPHLGAVFNSRSFVFQDDPFCI